MRPGVIKTHPAFSHSGALTNRISTLQTVPNFLIFKTVSIMKNSSKILLAMGASALVGGIAGYYLNSDNGRKARRRAVKNIKKTADEATDKINDMADTAKTAIGEFAGQAKAYMNTITEAAGDTLMAAEEKLEKGKEAAKAKVQSVKNAIMTNSVES